MQCILTAKGITCSCRARKGHEMAYNKGMLVGFRPKASETDEKPQPMLFVHGTLCAVYFVACEGRLDLIARCRSIASDVT